MIPELDLHGIKHEDVRKICDRFMTEIWGTCDEARIITGNSESMQHCVKEALSCYDLDLKVSIQNTAVIRVIF